MNFTFIKSKFPGFLVALLLAIVAIVVSKYLTFINVILLGFIMGVLVGNSYKFKPAFSQGFSFTGSKMIEISIVFLAFSINFSHLKTLGWQSLVILIVVVTSMILLTVYLSKLFKFKDSTAWLTGFGTVICGSAAIASAAPVVAQKKEDVAIALAVVNLLGSIAMIALPALFSLYHFTPLFEGLVIGGTLHSVANVAGAAYSVSQEVGETALTIKLARVALLSPSIIFFNFLINKDKKLPWTDYFKLPAYLWLFFIISIFTSVFSIPSSFIKMMEESGKILLTIAMTAIGLNIHIGNLLIDGRKAIIFGVVIYFIQLILLGGMGLILLPH